MSCKIYIRNMKFADLSTVLDWRNDIRTRSFMFDSNLIDYDTHVRWFKECSKNPLKHLLLVCSDEIPFGFVQFLSVNDAMEFEWGCYVNPDCQQGSGKLMGRAALDYAHTVLGARKVRARVLSSNSKSFGFHSKLGFSEDSYVATLQLTEKNTQDVHYMSIELPHVLTT